ncbi:MAG: L-serine ammonia-lyase, iron-sulfur-dependent, subunit beta [Treponema sp.]|nr:MAG: L-serine ammonia-lyase, iron-sulfur-dependent, subunit beta [Treponema sp.]
MNIFDIIGPVMIGPSSSHTAGAARIGYISRVLLNEDVLDAKVYLHGSFANTGSGHGTDKAIIAGLLGMKPHDERLPESFEIAKTRNLNVKFENVEIDDAHPNTVAIFLTGINGKKISVQASSVGGGNIEINKIDGKAIGFSGRSPTIIVEHNDVPGTIANITRMTGKNGYNIFQINIKREKKGGKSIMTMELDGKAVDENIRDVLMKIDNVINVIILQPY